MVVRQNVSVGAHDDARSQRSLHLRLPDRASASIDDVEVYVGSATDHRKDAPAEGTPHVVLTGQVVFGSVIIRGQRRALLRRSRL